MAELGFKPRQLELRAYAHNFCTGPAFQTTSGLWGPVRTCTLRAAGTMTGF